MKCLKWSCAALTFIILGLLSNLAASLRNNQNSKNDSYYLHTTNSSDQSSAADLASAYTTTTTTTTTIVDQSPKLKNVTETLTSNSVASELDSVNYNLISPSYVLHLEKSSIIFGLAKTANVSNVNPICHTHFKNIQRGIQRKEPWAMKVLDASGSKPSGFLFGQNYWFGSREACGAVRNPVGITLSQNFPRVMNHGILKEIAPFDIDYRVIYLRHNSPWQVEIKLMSEQIIHIGLCLPASCSSPEVQQLMGHYISEGLFVENDIYDIQPEVIYMKDLKIPENYFERLSFKMFSVVMAFILAMLLLASHLRDKSEKSNEKVMRKVAPTMASREMADSDNDDTSTASSDNNDMISLNSFPKIKNFIMCFDLQNNAAKLFSTKDSQPSEIPVINGLRSVCALWILLFHVMWYMYFTVNNKTFLISYAEKIFFQYVSSAPVLVDVFFTISGFLQTYNFLRNTQKMEMIRANTLFQNLKQFFKMFFHRYLRLGPLYLVVMAVVDLYYSYINNVSVYHISDRFDQNCANHWWRNIFFVQNLFDHNDMCLNWTWSMACEMQYFVIATALLFVYAKNPQLVKPLTLFGLTATIIWSYAIGYKTDFELSFDTFFATGNYIYISPFVRVLPYILGAVAGWYFLEHKQRKFELTEFQEKCLWNASLFVFFVCMYSTVKRDMGYFMSTTLFVVGRFLFALSISWMIIGSATGRGCWWSRFLESKFFQHLNRLSYGIYLLNPFVIALFFSLTSDSTHADPFMLCVLCAGFTVIVYCASIVFSLVFEIPFCNWSSLMLKQEKLNVQLPKDAEQGQQTAPQKQQEQIITQDLYLTKKNC